MAARRFGITVAWTAAVASTAMLAVPVGAAWHAAPVGDPSTSSMSARAGCSDHEPWTFVPEDGRLGATEALGTQSSVVSVRVPRTAVVSVDGAGEVVAAWTNTGCPPGVGDQVWVQHPDGVLTRSHDRSLLVRRWTGDFSRPGVTVSQMESASGH